MALTVVGSASAAGTSVAIPAHAVGDIIVVIAYRDGSNTNPTQPAAGGTVPSYTIIDNTGGANTNAMRASYAIATATNHTTGTWTNATGVAVIVLRGQHPTTRIGAVNLSSASTTNTVNAAAATTNLQRLDGTSKFLYVYAHRNVTAWAAAPAGYTRLTSVATELAVNVKDVSTTAPAQAQTCTAAVGGNRAMTIEVIENIPAGTYIARDLIPTAQNVSGTLTTNLAAGVGTDWGTYIALVRHDTAQRGSFGSMRGATSGGYNYANINASNQIEYGYNGSGWGQDNTNATNVSLNTWSLVVVGKSSAGATPRASRWTAAGGWNHADLHANPAANGDTYEQFNVGANHPTTNNIEHFDGQIAFSGYVNRLGWSDLAREAFVSGGLVQFTAIKTAIQANANGGVLALLNQFPVPGTVTDEIQGFSYSLANDGTAWGDTIPISFGGGTQTLDGGGQALNLTQGGGSVLPGAYTILGSGIALALSQGDGRLLPGSVTIQGGGLAISLNQGGGTVSPAPFIMQGGGQQVNLTQGGGSLVPLPHFLQGGGQALNLTQGDGLLLAGNMIILGSGQALNLTQGGGALVPSGVSPVPGQGTQLQILQGGGNIGAFVSAPPATWKLLTGAGR